MKRILGFVAAFAWLVCGVTFAIRRTAGDGGLLAAEMLRAAPPEVSGLPEKDYAGVGTMTAEYLCGKRADFQYVVSAEDPNGTCMRREVFQAHEAAHMADCRALVALDGRVCIGSFLIAALCAAAGLRRRKDREAFLRGALWGAAGFAGIAACLGIWALADFDGLFVAFHRIAFPQGGWILNSETDLLIRLMPVPFFIRLGVAGLVRFGLFAAVTGIAGWIGWKHELRRDEPADGAGASGEGDGADPFAGDQLRRDGGGGD